LRESAKKVANEEAIRQLGNLDKLTIGLSAYQIMENPHLRTQITAGDNVQAKQALELADRFSTESAAVKKKQEELRNVRIKIEEYATKIDPTRVLRPGEQRLTRYDPNLGGFVEVDGTPSATVSPQEFNTLKEKAILIQQDIAKTTQFWSSYGLNATDPRDKSFLQSREQLEQQQNSIQQTAGLTVEPPKQPVNPKSATAARVLPPVAPLKQGTQGGRKITLPVDPKADVHYGYRDYRDEHHPIRGGMKFHNGVDIAAPTGTPIRTIAGGKVVHSGNVNPTGYGNTVVIQTATGEYEQYSHNHTNTVKVGQIVAPGQQVGTVGSTGGSTGPHIHMTIWKPGTFNDSLGGANRQTTIDPYTYMARDFSKATAVSPVRNQGAPAITPAAITRTGRMPSGLSPIVIQGLRRAGIDPNNIQLDPVQYTVDPYTGVGAETGSINGGRNPARVGSVSSYQKKGLSINLKDYRFPNDPEADYGYKELREDAPFRRKLAQVADEMKIPAVWLADVMYFESAGFQASIVNSIGATGLIQFMPETARGLGTTTAELARMGRVRQMDYVKKYFNEINGRIKSPGDVLSFIFGGYGLFSKPEARRNGIGDGNIGYGAYKRRLGESVGRSYAFPI
jgi:murein DD-endopeptidase MepM/ murein hydrolase activator NlpD